MEATLISQGLDLMLFGMGTVFGFLTLLVGITHVMSTAVNYFTIAPELSVSAQLPVSSNASVDPRIIAAIQLAIKEHRGR
ncbi:MAG: OadG family protein [Porticoccaceae bacterium]|nr:OadG family protein [Porticoccaceae bacterium]MDG1475418.1 OadG family protein [Porticoccaceae bacterium]